MPEEIVQPDERELLKERAEQLGIPFKANTPTDKLRELVAEKLAPKAAPESPQAKRIAIRKMATKLVRINITCMDPNKTHLDGDFFHVGSKAIGKISRFVPFGTEEGTHVEYALYKMIEGKHCQVSVDGRDKKGRKIKVPKQIKAYAVQVLPDLTAEELKDLAQRQRMAAGKE